jgi:hypothetical protein
MTSINFLNVPLLEPLASAGAVILLEVRDSDCLQQKKKNSKGPPDMQLQLKQLWASQPWYILVQIFWLGAGAVFHGLPS